MKRLIYVVPVLAFAVLAYILFKSLIAPPPSDLPSVLVGKPAPDIVLPPLDARTKGFGAADFRNNDVTVVNVFASWCAPCREEAPTLAEIGRMPGVALYGFVYKDAPAKARGFLAEVGNPFQRIALDADGSAAIEWGVYGVPETFIVDSKGVIRERFVGQLTPSGFASKVAPAIEAARRR